MAARLPVNELPFENDTELHVFELPDGSQSEPMTKRAYFDIAMADHYEKSNVFAAAKAAEAAARARVRALLYPDSWDKEGTDKFELPGGWVLEVKRTINVKIEESQLQAIRESIEKLPVDPDTGEVPTWEGALKFKPDLSLSGYNNLRDDVRVLLSEALEFTPGTPGVKVIPPKPKAAAKASDQKAKAS